MIVRGTLPCGPHKIITSGVIGVYVNVFVNNPVKFFFTFIIILGIG
jgi:hypothetical protein